MSKSMLKPSTGPIRIFIALLIIGALFKILHLPYSNIIMSASIFMISVFYIIRFSKKQEKVLEDFLKLGMVVFWSLQGIFGLFHLPYQIVFLVGFWTCTVWWFLIDKGRYFNRFKPKPSLGKFSKTVGLLFYVGIALTVGGVLFKILHLYLADLCLIIGLGSIALAIVFNKSETIPKK